MWSVDSKDYARNGYTSICRTIKKARVHAGDIVLLYEYYPETIDAMPEVLFGSELGIVSDLLVGG